MRIAGKVFCGVDWMGAGLRARSGKDRMTDRMNRIAFTMAAGALLAFGTAACSSDSSKTADAAAAPEAAAPAADANAAPAAAAADAGAPAASSDKAAAPDAAAPDAAAPAADANASAGAQPAPAAETAAVEAPQPQQSTQEMMREIRNGGHSVNPCTKIDDVTTAGFNQCVAGALTAANAKGPVTDAFQLGLNYRAWSFMGEHIQEMREKGLEWSKGYRLANQSRETYRKTASDLIDKTGLTEKQVCGPAGVSDCPEK